MCCLFGLIDYGHTLSGKQKSRIISALATAFEVRGKDATGIAYNNNGKGTVNSYAQIGLQALAE